MDNLLFSIVVPVYNVEDYLSETVDTLLAQAQAVKGGVEILLVDDGSTDGSGQLCDRYATEYPDLVQVFHKENEGLLLTRRYGFRQAKGTYILNCDSDDTLEPDALSLLETLVETRPEVVIFNINTWTSQGKTPFSQDLFPEGPVDVRRVRTALFSQDGVVSMCGKLIRRDCLDLQKDYSGYFRKSSGEDTIQSVEIYSRAQSYLYCNRALYNYRTGSGMTSKANPDYFGIYMDVCQVLESVRTAWDLPDFDLLMAEKVLGIAGRAITQTRFDRSMSFATRKQLLKDIQAHPMFITYCPYFYQLSFKGSYRLLLKSLLKNRYRMIHWSLKLKNLLS